MSPDLQYLLSEYTDFYIIRQILLLFLDEVFAIIFLESLLTRTDQNL